MNFWQHKSITLSLLIAIVGLAGCAPSTPKAPTAKKPAAAVKPECVAPATNDPLIGNWLSKHQEKGMAGELRTLITLNEDGTMAYTQQIKRPRQPSQGISEQGCWTHNQARLQLQTLTSNGADVDLDDPLYTNTFTVRQPQADQLRLQGDSGSFNLVRTSPGYRLPF